MRINKTIFLMIMPILLNAQNPAPQVLTLWETQPGGLNTNEPSHTLQKTDFKDINNVYTDEGLFAKMREGTKDIWYSTAVAQNAYEYINLAGSRYLIVKSSQYLAYVDTDNTYKQLISTLPASARLWKIQYLNDCYLGTNQITNRWKFDPTATNKLEISTFIPCGKYPLEAFDKVFMANISTPLAGASPITTNNDKSIVQYCNIGDLKAWDGTAGDQWLGISRNDGEDITAAFKFKGNVYVGKQHSIHQLLNVDDADVTNDGSICVMPNIGILGQDTFQEINGNAYWLSADGVVEWTGTSYNIISKDIAGEIDILKNRGQLATDSFTDTSALDFGSGTCVNVDTTSISGGVFLSVNKSSNGITETLTELGTYDLLYINVSPVRRSFVCDYTAKLSTVAIYVGANSYQAGGFPVSVGIQDENYVYIASTTLGFPLAGSAWTGTNFDTWNKYLEKDKTYYIVLESSQTYYSYPLATRGYNITQSRVYQFGSQGYGSFASQKREITNFNQWNFLRSNFETTTGASIEWYVSVATATEICGTGYLTRMSTSSIIPSSAGGFVLWYASMTSNNSRISSNIIRDVTIDYFETITSNEELLTSYSDLKNLRYGLAGTKTSISRNNDVIYVYQINNNKWTKFDIPARSFGKFNGDLYFGKSAGVPYVDRFSYDYTADNGSPIQTMIRTPDYVLGTRANDCRFEELWTYAEPSVIYSSMTIQYYLNKSNTAFSTNTVNIPLTAVSGQTDMFIKSKVRAPIDRFRAIGFKLEHFERIYGIDFLYTLQSLGNR